MAAVQNLHTLPDAAANSTAEGAVASGGEAGGAAAAASGRAKQGGAQNSRQGRGRPAAATAAPAAPKASAAVAEMLDGASGCEDMDEIFKSLSAVLAEAQSEARQVQSGGGGSSLGVAVDYAGSPSMSYGGLDLGF